MEKPAAKEAAAEGEGKEEEEVQAHLLLVELGVMQISEEDLLPQFAPNSKLPNGIDDVFQAVLVHAVCDQ